jgi:hypothetical protein
MESRLAAQNSGFAYIHVDKSFLTEKRSLEIRLDEFPIEQLAKYLGQPPLTDAEKQAMRQISMRLREMASTITLPPDYGAQYRTDRFRI